MALTGKITDWNAKRGFGYVEGGGRKVFLHVRDFKKRQKEIEVGDVVHFELGADEQGRICAAQAWHANSKARLRVWHFAFLAFLVALPGLAIHRAFGPTPAAWIGGWCAAVSWFTYMIYAWDKRQARDQEKREPERILHFIELAGGWPGALLAQLRLRHKSSKFTYQFVFWIIVIVYEAVAVDFLMGWPLWRQAVSVIR